MKFQNTPPILDYRAFRLLMGFIAILLGPIVTIWANTSLSSVSASYHTNAQDVFVGLLFVVSAFLWAYNGHTSEESRASKAASAAALLVALFPTACGDCDYDWVAYVHAGAAISLFSILTYFCFGPFQHKTRNQPGKKTVRSRIYYVCGWIMVASMAAGLLLIFILSRQKASELGVIYWAETIALTAFGIGWLTASKFFSWVADDTEALKLFPDKTKKTDESKEQQ